MRRRAGLSRSLERRLLALPRLRNGPALPRSCKICGAPATIFDVVDFNKWCSSDFYSFGLSGISVVYYRCRECSFVYTNFFDCWTNADFSKFVYNRDYGLVDPEYGGIRASRTARELSTLLAGCEDARILDYGAGAGHFAAEMRKLGFPHVASYDPYTVPERPRGPFDIITCLETLEHTVDPVAVMAEMRGLLADGGAIIIEQSLQPCDLGEIRGNWWYIAPRNGHVSIFSEESFIAIAERFALTVHWGNNFYGFALAGASAALEGALARLGPTSRTVRLFAPAGPANKDWHEPELHDSTIPFRWSRSPELAWGARPFHPGQTTIAIPFIMEIVPGFAAGARLYVGTEALPIERTQNEIVGLLRRSRAAVEGIRLVTPEPLRPGTEDQRSLGLAVPLKEAELFWKPAATHSLDITLGAF